MEFAVGDVVRICSSNPSVWGYYGLTGRVSRAVSNKIVASPAGLGYRVYEVEFVDPKYPGNKQLREFHEDELVPWNGVDRMLAILDDNK